MTTTVAFVYDFDGTLAPGNMQERDFIPDVAKSVSQFWSEAKEIAQRESGDEILAYMGLMIKEAKYNRIKVSRDSF